MILCKGMQFKTAVGQVVKSSFCHLVSIAVFEMNC